MRDAEYAPAPLMPPRFAARATAHSNAPNSVPAKAAPPVPSAQPHARPHQQQPAAPRTDHSVAPPLPKHSQEQQQQRPQQPSDWDYTPASRGIKRDAPEPARPAQEPRATAGGRGWKPPQRGGGDYDEEEDAPARSGFRSAASYLPRQQQQPHQQRRGGQGGGGYGGAPGGGYGGGGGDNRDVFGPGPIRGSNRQGRSGFQPPRMAGDDADDQQQGPGGFRRRPRMQKAEAAATRAVLGNRSGNQRTGGGGGGAYGGGGGAAGGQQGAGGGGEEEGPMDRVLAALGLPDGSLPESLQQMDPALLDRVLSEVMSRDNGVRFDSVSGLEHVKRSINESLVWPMKHPELFTGLRSPQRGLLLFGPPGTGKTLIGKAIAGEAGATFFSIQASSLTSKWIGEGEKMVRALFAVAALMMPAVVFIDEIDSVLSARGDSEHEASRRMKTELLTAVDGLGTSGESSPLLIGATNRPEDLDEAARRRMPQRLMVGLPNGEARRDLILRALETVKHGGTDVSESDLQALVAETDGYSGSDLKSVLKDASLEPIREMQRRVMATGEQIDPSSIRALRAEDVRKTLRRIRPSVEGKELERYAEWDKQHGTLRIGELDDEMPDAAPA